MTNDAGTGCLSAGPTSFTGVQSALHWSSSALEGDPSFAWVVSLNGLFNLGGAHKNGIGNTGDVFVWPVRGRQ